MTLRVAHPRRTSWTARLRVPGGVAGVLGGLLVLAACQQPAAPAAKPPAATAQPTAVPAAPATAAPTPAPAAPTAAQAAPPTAAPKPTPAPAADATAAPTAAPKPAATASAPARKVANSGYADGDVVTLIVPTNPGGGYDLQARLLQPYLEKSLKTVTGADVRVVVQNVTGAQLRVGMERSYASEANGKTIVITSAHVAMGQQIFSDAQYDVPKMTPLVSIGPAPRGIAIRKDLQLPERTFRGLLLRSTDKPILLGHIGYERELKLLNALLREKGEALRVDGVTLDGTAPMMTALLRGDTEAAWSATAGMVQFVADNPDKLEMLVVTGCDREPAAPTLPTIVEQKVPNAEVICQAVGEGSRLFLGPPGLPAATAEALSEALRVAITDPEHGEKSVKAGFYPVHAGPDYVRQVVQTVAQIYAKYKQEMQ